MSYKSQQRCSGYRVFPDGRKCHGCGDCVGTRGTQLIKGLFTILTLWVALTCSLQAFKNPELTSTERLLLVPRNFILDFEERVK